MHRKDWSKASLIELLKYIEQQHCEINEKILRLQSLIEQAAELQKDEYSSTFSSFQKFYPLFKAEIENHFAREEQILLPYIRQMDDFSRCRGPKPEFHRGGIRNPISQIEHDHDKTENAMFDELHTITSNYRLPQDASHPLKALYDGMKDIETHIREHIYLESEILFPWAIKLELQLIHKR